MSTTTTTHLSLRAPIRPTLVRHRAIFSTFLAIWVLALAGCGSGAGYGDAPNPNHSSSSQSASAVQGSAAAVLIKDFQYSGDLTVKPGQLVAVTNQDTAPHTLTSTNDGVFDTGAIAASGGTKTFTAPSKAGSYRFGCTFHPDMSGTLVVK